MLNFETLLGKDRRAVYEFFRIYIELSWDDQFFREGKIVVEMASFFGECCRSTQYARHELNLDLGDVTHGDLTCFLIPFLSETDWRPLLSSSTNHRTWARRIVSLISIISRIYSDTSFCIRNSWHCSRIDQH